VRSRTCPFEALPDCALYACDAMHRDKIFPVERSVNKVYALNFPTLQESVLTTDFSDLLTFSRRIVFTQMPRQYCGQAIFTTLL